MDEAFSPSPRAPVTPVVPAVGRLRILLVEDSASVRALLSTYLGLQGHDVLVAEDGEQGVRMFDELRPDLVLMDVVMPELDGIGATRRMRAISQDRWVPVILMSTLDSDGDVIQGLDAGADDYLPKPVHLAVLEAKIRSFRRIFSMQAEIVDQADALKRLQDQQAYEHELAASLIESMVHHDGLSDPRVRWHVLPSARFSGDVVAAARCPEGKLYALLGDATGHGLAASVSLIPALQVFYGMVRKSLPLEVVMREINLRLREQLPTGRYFAAFAVRIDEATRRVDCWNGGMPSGMLVSREGELTGTLASRHLALGILPDADFDGECTTLQWSRGDTLIAVSDGLIEAENASGDSFGMDRVREVVTGARGADVVDRLWERLHDHLDCTATHDDASILAIDLS